MDCNKCTSWDEYSDLSDEESKQNEDKLINILFNYLFNY